MEESTYFILSTTNYEPDDLIQLGQIIGDPRKPYRRLAEPLQPVPLQRVSARIEWSLDKEKLAGGKLSVFAHFLNAFEAESGAHASRQFTQSWKAATMETRYLELGPDGKSQYVEDSLQIESVRNWLKENVAFRKSVYIVTGVKVALQPGQTTLSSSTTQGLSARVAGDPGTGGAISAGVDGGLDRTNGIKERGSSPARGFVFAYRLRKIHVYRFHKATLRGEVAGGDLWSVGDYETGDVDMDSDGGDEIARVTLERSDFGSRLPSMDLKLPGMDDNGEDCCVVLASKA